jgi:hypothetical protein
MAQNPDTARTLRLIPRAAALELSSDDAPLRARWSGPTITPAGVRELAHAL